MRPVHVLVQRNRVRDFADGQMRGQRLLQEHAVHAGIRLETVEQRPHLTGGRVFGQMPDVHRDAGALARLDEIANVGQARFVLPDNNHREVGMNPRLA